MSMKRKGDERDMFLRRKWEERDISRKRKGDERDMSLKRKGEERDMSMKRKEAKKGPSSSSDAVLESEEPKIDIKSILKDIEFLGKRSFLILTLTSFMGSLVLSM